VSTPVLDCEAEFDEGVHRPVGAQHCGGEFEERILAAVQGFEVERQAQRSRDDNCCAEFQL
jgi:hypothetical protein